MSFVQVNVVLMSKLLLPSKTVKTSWIRRIAIGKLESVPSPRCCFASEEMRGLFGTICRFSIAYKLLSVRVAIFTPQTGEIIFSRIVEKRKTQNIFEPNTVLTQIQKQFFQLVPHCKTPTLINHCFWIFYLFIHLFFVLTNWKHLQLGISLESSVTFSALCQNTETCLWNSRNCTGSKRDYFSPLATIFHLKAFEKDKLLRLNIRLDDLLKLSCRVFIYLFINLKAWAIGYRNFNWRTSGVILASSLTRFLLCLPEVIYLQVFI